jgi:UDP-3-O-[3-hydroxymyristoyl] N-acetylglucosamine deacetylase / 3-hydroxyacyl-[acyl-carrier-protein] dehydratase
MTSPQQQTLAGEASFEGVGLHTGASTRVRFRAAPVDHGIRFRRVDLEGEPEIRARLEQVASMDRGTMLAAGAAQVYTVEHLLAAVAALEIDNLSIELDGPEVPIADGSFRPFLELLREAGVEGQGAAARVVELAAPLYLEGPAGSSYAALPSPSYRVSVTIEFDHPLIRRQHGAYELTGETFARELAPARTFGFVREAEQLRARGLVKGVTEENAVVLGADGLLAGAPLRFPDEFVRHKAGDLIGDLALIGRRVRAHVVAERPSHAGNLALAKQLQQAAARQDARAIVDIQKIMQYLPHRFPMLLVDRIIEFESGTRIVGIKNVTINEPFFQGHYPGHPIMPGVLIIEAMAQCGGLLLMDAIENPEEKVVYFMSLDNVKWRRPVTPGDQIRFELEMLQFRRHTCRMKGVGLVDGQVVAEAEMMARIVDR